jgi:hypothetical protein
MADTPITRRKYLPPKNKHMKWTNLKLSVLLFFTLLLLTTIGKAQSAPNVKTDSKNCGCDYFPLCKFDKSRSFMGEVWKGLDNNGKVTYYHCANGTLKAKHEFFDNIEGNSLGFATYTALRQNETKGSSWKDTAEINGAKYFYEHIIMDKNVKIKVGDQIYSDVIKVRRIVNAASMFYQGQPQNLMQIEYGHNYYVKNVGVFKESEVKSSEEMKQEEMISKIDQKQIQIENEKHPFFAALTDYYWVYIRPNGKEVSLQFSKESKYDGSKAFWRIKDNYIEFLYPPGNWYKAYEILTTNDGQKKLKHMQFANEVYIQSYRKN